MGKRKRRGKQIILPAVSNAITPEVISNSEAYGDQRTAYGGGLPANAAFGWQGFPGANAASTQLSQPGTLFANLRYHLVSNYRQMLNQAYAELGLVQTIVKVPVEDAMRGGITVSTAQLSEEEIAELMAFRDEQDDDAHASEAAEWNRLFGGAAIIIFSDQDPSTPFDMERLTRDEHVEFRAVDMFELYYDRVGMDEYLENMDLPSAKHFNYYGETIHHSRVIPMKGVKPPSMLRAKLRGWGISVLETLVTGINQYLKAANLTYEVLDEFKLDIYRIANFAAAAFGPSGATEGSVKDRVEIVNMMKNYQNAIVLDKEDDYESKQISFAGLAEAQAGIRMQIASDMRMPLTKLFGMSAAGFNSGEDDIEVYNGMIESAIRSKLKRPLTMMVKVRCMQLFGFIPDDLQVAFKPLRILSSTDEETVKTSVFSRALSARQAGEISADQFADICNRANVFPIKIEAQGALAIVDDEGEFSDGDDDERAGLDSVTLKAGEDENDDDEVATDMRGPVKQKTVLKIANNRKSAKAEKPAPARTPILVLPDPYTPAQKFRRALNSRTFDIKSYEADGGDAWIDPRRKEFFDDPVGVDQTLWAKARVASREAFGEIRWQFVAWMYRKLGGRFTA